MTTNRIPRYLVRKNDHVGGQPIPEDEPVLVIRAQDRLAIPMIDLYLSLYQEGNFDFAVLQELAQHRDAIKAWQAEHGSKVADR